jgi:hypothetical protein
MYDILTLRAWLESLYRVESGALIIEPFGYSMSFTALAAVGGTQTQNLTINANADFVCTRLSYRAGTGAVQNVGNKTAAFIRATIIDAGSSRPFFNSAVDLENIASNDFPNRFLAYPRLLTANTAVSATLTGYGTAAETYTVDLFFDGVSVRQFG